MSLNIGLLTGTLAEKPREKRTSGSPIVELRLRTSVRMGKDKTASFDVPMEAFFDEVKAALLRMDAGDAVGFRYETHCYNGKKQNGDPYDIVRLKINNIEFYMPAAQAAAAKYPKPAPEEPEVDFGDDGSIDTDSGKVPF